MKFFVVSTLLLVASCSASHYGAVSSQYHSQGHQALVVSHAAPYVHSAPLVHHAVSHQYVAHADPWAHGVIAAPWSHGVVAHGVPHDTPEVAAAKLAHFAAHAEARARHHLHKRSAWGGPSYQSWNHAPAPVIHNGVPVETPEVQQAKAAHAAAHAAVQSHAPAPHHYQPAAPQWNHAPVAQSWNHAPAPQIHNGVPVETPEVQHAKAAHFAAVAEARSHSAPSHHQGPSHYAPVHHQGSAYHIPVIQNGVPVETPEVQHAKAAHFAAVAEAQSHSGHHAGSWHGDNSWNNGHHDW